MDRLAPVPIMKKVRIHAEGGFWVHEAEVNIDQYLGDLFEPVFQQYNYVYIKSDKALEYSSVAEYRVRRNHWLGQVIRNLDLDKEAVINIHAENKPEKGA